MCLTPGPSAPEIPCTKGLAMFGPGLKFKYQTKIVMPKRQNLLLDKTKYYPQSKQTPWTCVDHSSGFGVQ